MTIGAFINLVIVSFISVVLLLVSTWSIIYVFFPTLKKYNELASIQQKEETVERFGLTLDQANKLFDKNTDTDSKEQKYIPSVQTDSFDGLSLEGPLVPLDCEKTVRVCLTDADCTILCKPKNGIFDVKCHASDLVCRTNAIDTSDTSSSLPPDQPEPNCKTDKGEYALLQGYNELGIAQWNCVQLYPGWMDYNRYCENGTINIDTRKRAPSYLDCTCSENNLRVVYAKSLLGQEVFGLPHCVDKNVKHLYESDYLFV